MLCAPTNFYFISHLALVYVAQCFYTLHQHKTQFVSASLCCQRGKTPWLTITSLSLQSARNHAFKTCFHQANCTFSLNYREQGGEALHFVKWHTFCTSHVLMLLAQSIELNWGKLMTGFSHDHDEGKGQEKGSFNN